VDEKSTIDDGEGHHQPLAVVDERYIHSEIFARLVKGRNDLPGIIAYGIYQTRKRAWIEAYKTRHGALPTVDELKGFSFGFQDDALAALREEAEGDMFRFAETLMNERTSEMMKTAFDARVIAEVESLRVQVRGVGRYRHHVVGHLIGFAVLVAGVN
jgi:hypothetical protein